MKLYFTILIAISVIGCSSDDVNTVTNLKPIELGTNESIYKILDTNITQLTVKRFRDSLWESKSEWSTTRMIPVKKNDVILITSSGEISTPEKELYLKYDGDNDNGTYHGMIGTELQFNDIIGKPW